MSNYLIVSIFSGRGCDESDLRDLDNGVVKREMRGAVFTFQCDDKYFLQGSPTIVCDGQKWNDTKPSCLSKLFFFQPQFR